MIDKGHILPVQCKMNLSGPKSMRKVNDLRLIFTDFYVPALTPRLNGTETSLQLSENMTLFAVCHLHTGVISKESWIDTRCLGRGQDGTLWRPCLYITWRRHFTFDRNSELSLWQKNKPINLIRLIENSNSDNLYSKPRCRVVSKAYSIYKNTATVDILLLKFKVAWSVKLLRWSVVLWRSQTGYVKVEVKVTLRLTVSQSLSLGVEPHIFITGWQLRSCFCGAPSLTRGRVCLLYMLLALASAVFLRSESLGTVDHILLSQIWDFPFRPPLRLAGSLWRYSNPPPLGWETGYGGGIFQM
jgi:hypothetical protein